MYGVCVIVCVCAWWIVFARGCLCVMARVWLRVLVVERGLFAFVLVGCVCW